MNFEEQRKAYEEDPVFHHVVNMLVHFLLEGQCTVGELRDAATFAGIKFESEKVRPGLALDRAARTGRLARKSIFKLRKLKKEGVK